MPGKMRGERRQQAAGDDDGGGGDDDAVATSLQIVHFRSLEKPEEDDFRLELSKLFTYDDVVERVAQQLDLDDPSKIRLTSHNCYSQQPKPQPIKYRGVDHLSDMLVHYSQTSDILYYEVLDIPLPELQGLKTLKVAFHHATKDEVVIHSIRLPKQSTVGDVINDLKTKVELSHPNAELRLLEVFYHKIYKVFPTGEKIEKINDKYWTLRAEEIPEEEKNLGPQDRLIHVYHFTKDATQNQMQVQNFGEPFFLIIHEGETLAEVKVRIQKKLQVPDEEFSKWKFAVLSLGRPEYLQDSDIVFSRFQRRGVYGAWEQYLGLEHSDTAPKRVYTPSQEKKKMATVERGRASWSNENKKIFIDLCIEEVQIGGRLGSHLKASSWKKIITSFNEKTKLNYDQKQLKNMWDIMKKQYAAWKKLLNQTGIGYNEDTHIVTMERERWEKYLKANPDVKVFHTKPLQFPKEMAIIFDGTMATGETKPDDMLRMPLENHNLSFASNHMSPQSSNFQEEDQEIELEDQLAEVRRKRPCPSRRKKHSGNDALVVSIDNLVSSIDSTFKTDGPTIAECIASLKKFPNVPDSLYIYALNAFRIKENREVWMSEDDDRIRMMWLKANADGSFVA